MKSRLHIIVVLLFVGIAGVVFTLSGKNSENNTGLEVVDEISSADTDSNLNSSIEEIPQKKRGKTDNDNNRENAEVEIEDEKIFVHVCGSVKKEGVYQLEADARVIDAIEAAGGFSKNAATYGINQAEELKDGVQVYIPSKDEVKSGKLNGVNKGGEASSDSQNKAVNINTATKEELMQLNGVGESKAGLIITYREANGGFKAIADLMKIKGIKQKFFDKIKDNICVK